MAEATTEVRVRIFARNAPSGEPLSDLVVPLRALGNSVQIPGFSGGATVHVGDLAATLRDGALRAEAEGVALETIVKFGATQQLQTRVWRVLEVVPSSPGTP